MAGRFPGAPDLDSFWDVVLDGRDAVADGLPERLRERDWSVARREMGEPARDRLGGFLDRIDEFDADFFGVSPREAVRMNPAHRMLLEASWEAVEDSGTPADALAGSRTSVFTSFVFGSEYWDLLVDNGLYDMHALLGAGVHGTAAGRVAYAMDLRGPTMAVDATCAGSLLAVHLACRSIRDGESETAIVASANVQIDQVRTAALARGRVLSRGGACRFADTRADGYLRSDGVVAVVLKPLRAAQADGDRVYATVLGSGTSSVGRGGGSMIAPSGPAQAAAIRAAHADAGVRGADIDYVEAHGTGTTMGDRTELTALDEVLGAARPPGRPCLVGSVKSNVGHSEAAAGLTGLVKTALALRHGVVPPAAGVEEQNPVLSRPGSPLALPRAAEPWPERGGRRLAGVSSFGMSGTNVHVVLSGGPARERVVVPARQRGFVLPVSGRSPAAVRELAAAYADHLCGVATGDDLRDFTYSAGARRIHHPHRAAVVGVDRDSVVAGLRGIAEGVAAPGVVEQRGPVAERPRVVFVFPGQGGQWVGMGHELLTRSRVFRNRLRECDEAVCAEAGWSVLDLIACGGRLDDVEVVQPALWAVQVSLAAMWADWGVEPDLVIGHSMGEIAAATVAGAISVRDAAAVVCRRARLIRERLAPGAMVAVQLGEAEADAAIRAAAAEVSVAVVNSSRTAVLCGAPEALGEVVAPLRDRGVFCRELPVDFASHGPHVEPLRGPLLTALSGLRPRRARVPLHSTALDRRLDGGEMDAAYWMTNLRRTVRFASAVRSVLDEGRRTLFVEVSPHPVLSSAIEDAIDRAGADSVVVASLRRHEPQTQAMLTGLAEAYAHGAAPTWDRLNPGGAFTPLPAYPWQRRRFWPGEDTRRPAPPTPRSPTLPGPRTPATDLDRYLLEQLSCLLSLDPGELDPARPLPRLGVDSLLAATLRAAVKRDLGITLPVDTLLGAHTLADVATELRTRLTEAR